MNFKTKIISLITMVLLLGLLSQALVSGNNGNLLMSTKDHHALTAVLGEDSSYDTRVRVVHASPDAPAVDVWVNGSIAFSNIAYEDITDYAPLPYGAWEITVVETGTTMPAVIGPVVLDLKNNTDYTVVALNNLANIEPLVMVDDNSPVGAGNSRIRVVHASYDAPNVDVALQHGGGILLSDVPFKGNTYLEVPAGTYDLEINVTGTNTRVLDLAGTTLMSGEIYTVYAIGMAIDPTPTLEAGLFEDSSANANIRVFHASPDAPAVDVLVDSAPAFSNLAFQSGTVYASLPFGTYNVTVVGTGTTSPGVIGPVDLTFDANTDYTIVALNNLTNIEPLIMIDDNSPVGADNARVRVVHASYDAPNVDVALQNGGGILLSDVPFKGNAYLEVPAGTYDLEVNVTGTNTRVLDLAGTTFENGKIYTVYATDVAASLTTIVTEDADANTMIQVIHASPDAPNVDVLVDGATAFPNLAYGETSGYASLPYETYNITVVGAGTSGPAVIGPANFGLTNDTDYSVVAVNYLASIEPMFLVDDNSPVTAENARIRFIHTSANAPSVDIALAGGAVLFSDISFKEVGDYIEVPADTYDLEVRAAGTSTVVLDLPGISLANGSVYSVYAFGLINPTPLKVILSIDANADARVRVMHASPDAPAVDVWVNGSIAFSNIAYKEITEYASLPYGSWEISVVPTGETTPVVIGPVVLDLENDTDYTVLALNNLANIEPIVLVDDNSPVKTEDTRVRFVHASLDAPAVDIVVSGGPTLFGDIEFKEVGDYIEVGAGIYDLEVLAAGTSTVALDLPGIDISEGAVYTVFAVGYLNPFTETTTTTTITTTTPTTTDSDTPGFGLFAIMSFVVFGSIYAIRKRR